MNSGNVTFRIMVLAGALIPPLLILHVFHHLLFSLPNCFGTQFEKAGGAGRNRRGNRLFGPANSVVSEAVREGVGTRIWLEPFSKR